MKQYASRLGRKNPLRPGYRTLRLAVMLLWVSHPVAAGQGFAANEPANFYVGYSKESFQAVHPQDAKIAMELWINKLCSQSGISFKPQVTIVNKLDDMANGINNNTMDLIGINSYDYLMIRNKAKLDPVLFTTFNNKNGLEYVLLVNKELNVSTLGQLKQKKVLLHLSTNNKVPFLWLDSLLKKQGLPVKESFFGSCKEVEKPSQAVISVFFGQADACLVSREAFETMAELNPQISHKLQILATSSLFVESLVVFRQGYDQKNKKIITETALNLKKYPDGQQIMNLFRIGGFAPFSEGDLASVKNLLQESGSIK